MDADSSSFGLADYGIIVGIILGILGFAVSGYLASIEFWRRRQSLRLTIDSLDLFGHANRTAYVLAHISLINHATRPRTVYRIRFQDVGDIHVEQVPGLPNLLDRLVTFSPQGWHGAPRQVLLDDTASWPLDVEPERSRGFFLALTVSPIYPEPVSQDVTEDRILLIPVLAESEDGQLLARTNLRVPL